MKLSKLFRFVNFFFGCYKLIFLKINLFPNRKMIEVEFSEKISNNYICLNNSTESKDWESEKLLLVSAVKKNDSFEIEKNFTKCSSI